MRSIEKRYRKFYKKDPFAGEFIILMRTVRGMKFSQRVVSKFLDKIMRPEDYAGSSKNDLVKNLMFETMRFVPRCSRSDKKQVEMPLGDVIQAK